MARKHPLPFSKAVAIRSKLTRYIDLNGCFDCRAVKAQRYVEDDSCVDCLTAQLQITNKLDPDYCQTKVDAIARGLPGYYDLNQACQQAPHALYRDALTGRCLVCSAEKSPQSLARAAGQTHYKPNNPCKKCFKKAMRTTDTDECTNCNPVLVRNLTPSNKPRERAKQRGDMFYMPTVACGACGSRKVRRVFDDKCKCEYSLEKRGAAPPLSAREQAKRDKKSMYISPEPCPSCGECRERLTKTGRCPCDHRRPEFETPERYTVAHIPRRHAEALGFRYYQTNERCIRGHIDPRYVSTGVCMRCVWESSDKR